GISLFLALSWGPAPVLLGSCILIFGLCQGARGPLVSALAAKGFAGKGHATVYGTILASNAIGAALGSFLAGAMHDLTGGYRASFMFSLVSIVFAAMPFFTVKE